MVGEVADMKVLNYVLDAVGALLWFVWTYATSVMIGSGVGLLLDSTFDTYPLWFKIGYWLGWIEATVEIVWTLKKVRKKPPLNES